MDWPTIINEILWMAEITEKELVESLNVPVRQSCINRLKKGHVRQPHYALGHELIQWHKKLKRAYSVISHSPPSISRSAPFAKA